MAWCGTPI